MRLSKLVLHNYRKFEDYTVPLHPEITLLIGKNGSGKSAILDAASVALGTFLIGIDIVRPVSIGKADARVVQSDSSGDLSPQYPVSISAKGCIDGQQLTWSRSLHSPSGKTTTSQARSLLEIAEQYTSNLMNCNAETILPILAYYGPRRHWFKRKSMAEIESLMRFRRQSGYINCLAAEQDDTLLQKWLVKMTLQEMQRGGVIPELKAVQQAVAKSYSIIAEVGDVTSRFNIQTLALDIIIERGERHETIPVPFMSDGYKCVLGLVCDIACRMAILNPQLLDNVLQTPGVVLIDDVELHLHPGEQQKIVELLRDLFPNVQFILSTHAPMVIGSVQKEQLCMLIPGNMASQPPTEVYGNDASSILRSVMETTCKLQKVQEMFDEMYDILETDPKKAKERLQEIIKLTGEGCPDVVSAETAIYFEMM